MSLISYIQTLMPTWQRADCVPRLPQDRDFYLASRIPIYAKGECLGMIGLGSFVRCPEGTIEGPNGEPRDIYVQKSGEGKLRCEQAKRMYLHALMSMAPFSQEEKNSMPFAKVSVYETPQMSHDLANHLSPNSNEYAVCSADKVDGVSFRRRRSALNPCSDFWEFMSVVRR